VSDLVLVDTNIVSYLFKKDSRGLLYEHHLENRLLLIAAQTLAELEAMPLIIAGEAAVIRNYVSI
jgi:predicted nucleic acid-binding protein